jgi:hypothetical protein
VKRFCFSFGCLILNSILSFGQVDVSAGITFYNTHNLIIGLSAGASIKNFHLDISSNLKGGNGEIQDYGNNLKTDDKFVFLVNTGYNIPLRKNWYILPVLGAGWESDIYLNQNNARNTYSYQNSRLFLNIGLYTKFFIIDDIGLILGCGYPELARVAVVYKLWN